MPDKADEKETPNPKVPPRQNDPKLSESVEFGEKTPDKRIVIKIDIKR
jgi:hypothetical protein